MSDEARREGAASGGPGRPRGARVRLRARLLWRATVSRFSSSLTRRIVTLNVGGLLVLVVGFLYLNQFRADIIDARVQSLRTQGEIIAAAIAASASVGGDRIQIDPEKLLPPSQGDNAAPPEGDDDSIEFSINPERVGPVLRRLVTPTRTRARIYDRDGLLLLEFARAQLARRHRPAGSRGRGGRGHHPVRAPLARREELVRPGQETQSGRALDRHEQDASRGRRRAARPDEIRRPRRRRRRDDRLGRDADPADADRPRRAAPLDPGRRHRFCHRLGALGHPALLAVARGGDVHSVFVPRQHDRRTRAQARRGGRASASRHQVAPAESRISRRGRTRSAISPMRCAT